MTQQRFASLALALAAVAVLTLAPAVGAEGLRIVRPHDDRFFAAAPVRVDVRAPRSVSKLSATLNSKPVGGRFEELAPGHWRARFGARALATGANLLVVSAKRPGARREYAPGRFLVGRRWHGLLSLAGPKPAGALVARVRLAARPRRLSARLNGRRLRWPLGLVPGRREPLRLGADDGLRFGSNRLQILAVRRDGSFDVERRRVMVPRNRPLAGAGPDRRGVVGHAIRLDGSRSRPARRGARLTYRWKIVVKPRGSRAHLRRASSAKPVLLPDRPGRYRVRLVVGERRRIGRRTALRRSADVLTAAPTEGLAPIGQPIETMVTNGKTGKEADTGIRIGEKTYWLGLPQGNDYQVVMLERDTLAPLYHASFPVFSNGTVKVEEKIREYGQRALVVLSFPDLRATVPDLALVPIVKSLGARTAPIWIGRPGWSVIGVPGTKAAAYLGAGSNPDPAPSGEVRGDLTGYLQEDSAGGFGFVPSSRVEFKMSTAEGEPEEGTIAVGEAKYKIPLPTSCANGGFQVLVLLAETLKPVEQRAFETSSCGPPNGDLEQQHMAEYLAAISTEGPPATEGPKLVLIQSIGQPNPGNPEHWSEIATQLERLGGTASVFAAATRGYALVGGIGISHLPLTEASESLTGKPAKISGLLAPDRSGAYVPQLSSPTGATGFALSTIAYQPPQPWPYSSSAGEKAALRYVAEEVLKLEAPSQASSCYVPSQPDVRSEYCNLEYANRWTTWVKTLEEAPFRAGHGFEKPEWEDVVHELADEEFEAVESVWTLVRFLKEAFGAGGATQLVDLKEIAVRIEKAITPPAEGLGAGWWLELFGNFGSVGSYFSFGLEGEYVQKVLGVLQGMLFESAASLSESDGEPTFEHFRLKASEIAVELGHRYLDASIALGFVGELLVSDYGKLQAMRRSGLFGISEKGWSKTVRALEAGAEQWSWERLVPSAYEAVSLPTNSVNKTLPPRATEYLCEMPGNEISDVYRPFKEAPPAAELAGPDELPSLGVMVVRGSRLPNGGSQIYPRTPPKGLLEPIFQPESQGGLNLYAPWFWRSALEYPASATQLSC